MKKTLAFSSFVIALVITMGSLAPSAAFAGDFFQDQVTQPTSKTATRELLRDIQVRHVALRGSTEKLRLAQTQFFVAQTKNEIVNRYSRGELSRYELEDIRNELTYLTHSMNQYFANVRAFERSNNRTFQNLATENLKDADQAYLRLKNTTLKASRNG